MHERKFKAKHKLPKPLIVLPISARTSEVTSSVAASAFF